MNLLRTAAREKFDTSLSGMRVSPDVGKQMGDAVQVCPTIQTCFRMKGLAINPDFNLFETQADFSLLNSIRKLLYSLRRVHGDTSVLHAQIYRIMLLFSVLFCFVLFSASMVSRNFCRRQTNFLWQQLKVWIVDTAHGRTTVSARSWRMRWGSSRASVCS